LSKKQEKYSSEVDNIDFRENKQPKWNTCGSFFKNPSKEHSAWKLIEEVLLKWFKIGWAYFSNIHANFLMNDWTATYTDLIILIDLAKNKVKNEFRIDLIPEVRIIYNLKK
jgi:UDP-N-acetylmuramate dehydrogenase